MSHRRSLAFCNSDVTENILVLCWKSKYVLFLYPLESRSIKKQTQRKKLLPTTTGETFPEILRTWKRYFSHLNLTLNGIFHAGYWLLRDFKQKEGFSFSLIMLRSFQFRWAEGDVRKLRRLKNEKANSVLKSGNKKIASLVQWYNFNNCHFNFSRWSTM